MAINWPAWVTDGSAVPTAYLTPAKKFVLLMAAKEKSRRLIQAIGHWYRVGSGNLKPDDLPTMSAAEQAAIAEYAPYVGSGWDFGRNVNDPPSLDDFRAWQTVLWEPRTMELDRVIAEMRKDAANFDLSWVNIGQLVSI